MIKHVHGRGGGGGGGGSPPAPYVPTEEPNNLSSRDRAKVLDILCEGEIEAIDEVYLDETEASKVGASYQTRTGAAVQSYIPGFDSVNYVATVGAPVKNGSPITRTINNLQTDAVRVVLRWGALFKQTDQGDILSLGVAVQISVNDVLKISETISGKQNSVFQRAFDIPLDGEGPWDIKVNRITEDLDEDDSKIRSAFSWQTVEEIQYVKLTYPDTAMAGFEFDSRDFGGRLPTRSYLVRGRKVRVPSNYDAANRTYTGVWDGTFQWAYSDNPAWIFYDLATNTRFGAAIPDADVDKWSLYDVATYCDESVDGEPRFQCNLVLERPRDAFTALQELASIFRGMAFYDTSSVTVSHDRSRDPVAILNNANVIDGLFKYQSAPLSERYSVAIISWNNPELQYKLDQETVVIPDLLQKYGERKKQITAVGCTTRAQAHRVGRWLLYTEENESDVVSFGVGLDQAQLDVGEIIEVADADAAGVRMGGRVVSHDSGTKTVTIDNAIDFDGAKAYTLRIIGSDNSHQERSLNTLSGEQTDLVYTGTALNIVDKAIWVVVEDDLETTKWRVLNIEETDHGFNISANRYIADKYTFIDSGLPADQERTSLFDEQASPDSLNIVKDVLIEGSSATNIGLISWDAVPGAIRYQMQIGDQGLDYPPEILDVFGQSYTYKDVDGAYKVRVRSVGILGQVSEWAEITWTFSMLSVPAGNVENFLSTWEGNAALLTWTPVENAVSYEIRRGSSWANSISVATVTTTAYTLTTPIQDRYLIKATAVWGGVSAEASLVDILSIVDLNIIETYDHHAEGFLGTKTQMKVEADGDLGMILKYMWESMTDPWGDYTEDWEDYNYQQSPELTTFIYESDVKDLGAVLKSRVNVEIGLDLISPFQTWENMVEPWEEYSLANGYTWDGPSGGVESLIEIRWSDDNVTWSSWTGLTSAYLEFRYIQTRLTLTRTSPMVVAEVSKLQTHVDVPDKSIEFNDVATGSGGTTIDYSAVGFVLVPTVVAAIQAGATGDTYKITSKTKTECIITVYDTAGVAKDGVVDVMVKGG